MTLRFVATRPSAILPIAMSLVASAVLLAAILYGWGVGVGDDEGAAARLWQALIAGQIPVIGYFAIRWLPTAPRQALIVLGAQIAAGLAAAAPVFLLHL